jgi:hypothetical protein
MLRETLDTGSKHAMAIITTTNGVALQGRVETNRNSFHYGLKNIESPCWLKLSRRGNRFTAYYSLNGETWFFIEEKTVVMPFEIYAGIATASLDNTLATVAVVDNLMITDVTHPHDSDNDGISPLLEYAFGGDPDSFDIGILPKLKTSFNKESQSLRLEYTYRRRLVNASNLNYTLLESKDLENWLPVDPPWTPLSIMDNIDGITESISIESIRQLSDQPIAFFELKVSITE